MAKGFDAGGLLVRWVFAVALVFGTYNPTEYSYVRWAMSEGSGPLPVIALVGIILLIGWIIYLRATFMSMGMLGIILGSAFFGCIVWLLVDQQWLTLNSASSITWVALLLISILLAIGISWSHIRRRLTGQVDVDDLED